MRIPGTKPVNSLILFLTVLFLSYSGGLNATHIIGGELFYKCLGDDKFEISLYVYRDCAPHAHGFDRLAPVLAFDEDNNRVWDVGVLGRFNIPRLRIDSVEIIMDDPCHIPPKSICMEVGFYRDTIELPFLEGGYQLVYQRCCRNRSIDNIAMPVSTAAAYYAFISERAFLECSEGIRFKNFNPPVVCKGEPIEFDHSVEGDTGDSVVYRLCSPLTEGFEEPGRPPFHTVIWLQDSFNVDNMLGSDDPLRIDPQTGWLSGTPSRQGQFVVGVCAAVYKDGEVINELRRDFQYNIGICDTTQADFTSFERYCNQTELSFINQSEFFLDQKWILGDIDDPLFESGEFEPEIDFPGLGVYDLTLIALGTFPGCNDTVTKQVEIVDLDFEIDIDLDYGPCGTRMDIDFISLIDSEFPDSNSFVWTGRWSNSTFSSTDSIWSVSNIASSSLQLDLAVYNPNANCWKSISGEFPTGVIPDDGQKLSHFICKGQQVELNPNYHPLSTYEWSPMEGLLDSITSPNPLASPEDTTLYTAEITNNHCSGELTALVEVFDQTIREVPDTICRYSEAIFTSPWGDESEDVQWYFYYNNTALLGSRIGLEVSHTFQTAGEWTVQVMARHALHFNCRDTLFIPIYVIDPEVSLDVAVQDGNCVDPFKIEILADVKPHYYSPKAFIWIVDGDTVTTDTPALNFETSGLEPVFAELVVPNDFGCDLRESIVVEVDIEDEYFLTDSMVICRPDTFAIETGISEEFDFNWSPSTYFISEPDSPEPLVYPQSSLDYQAVISHEKCTVHYQLNIELLEHSVELEPIFACDTLDVNAIANQEDRFDYHWYAGDISSPLYSAMGSNAQLSLPDFGEFPLNLVLKDSINGCFDTLETHIELLNSSDFDIEIIPQILDCSGPVVFELNAAQSGDLPFDLEFDWQVSGDTQFVASGQSIVFTTGDLPELEIELQISNEFGCDRKLTAKYRPGFTSQNVDPDSFEICLGDTILLNPNYSDELTFSWSPASGIIDLLTDPNPRASPSESMLYTAVISDGDCEIEKEVWVNVNPLPRINGISADPNPIIRNEQTSGLHVDFTPADATVEWMPPDNLDNPFAFNPIASPDSTTEYSVKIISAEGCTSRAGIVVEVIDLPCARPFVFLPNAFSPNGDGQNDVLYLRGDHVAEMELLIYNRQGQKVFHGQNQDLGWDGTFRGEHLPSGVYGYYLRATCVDGAKHTEQGDINLLR